MATRQTSDQTLHDAVIEFVQKQLDATKYDIYANPRSEQNWSVKGEFPDLLITSKENKQIKFVIEVETTDSVNPEEARNQWKAYADLPGVFYILVPQESLPVARQIIAGQGIQAKLGYYVVNNKMEVTNVEYNTE